MTHGHETLPTMPQPMMPPFCERSRRRCRAASASSSPFLAVLVVAWSFVTFASFARSAHPAAAEASAISQIEAAPTLGRIYNGEASPKGRYPYMVITLDKKGNTGCGGTLISPNMVLTAAHCRHDVHKVFIGGGHPKETKSSAQRPLELEKRKVKKVIEHPSFDWATAEYDFMLLLLSEPSSFTPILLDHPGSVKDGIRLPLGRDVEQSLVVMGFGNTLNGNSRGNRYPKELMHAAMSYISNHACTDAYKGKDPPFDTIARYNICAWNRGFDACDGDSGGPLIVQREGGPAMDLQVGVMSWGKGCRGEFPAVFSRVTEAFEWIEQTVKDHGHQLRVPAYHGTTSGAAGGG